MNGKQKKLLWRIVSAVILFVAGVTMKGMCGIALLFASYLTVGWDVLYRAFRNVLKGQWMDETFLMSIATVGALCLGEFPESVFVMLFYQVGELFQGYAVGKSRASVAELMNLAPDRAWIEENGECNEIDPEEIEIGHVMVIKPGEKIPADGIVEWGSSSLDTSALTGEYIPRSVTVGDSVISGCVNGEGLLKVRAIKEFSDSTVSKILELVEEAVSSKAKTEGLVTRFAHWYTPLVVALAVILFLVPPLLGVGTFGMWLHRSLTFLVVSCPCALVISVPLSFFGGIGCASRHGILMKGARFIEILADAQTTVFDKTGTLTQGTFEVTEITGKYASTALRLAAMAESGSNHPIARSVCRAYGTPISQVFQTEEIPGYGVKAMVEGKEVLVGNSLLMEQAGIFISEGRVDGTRIHVAADGNFLGTIVLSDLLKEDAKGTVEQLRKLGMKRIALCSGDGKRTAKEIGTSLGIEEIHAELLPQQKVALVEQLLKENTGVLYVGDGINDAPVLALADCGIAMGGFGSDAAMEAADVVLMDDALSNLPRAIQIARKTVAIVKQNIGLTLGIKLAVLLLGAFGITGMWEAVFADVGVAVLAICNAMRALYNKV